jgi:polysaccharide pyruvyl transferase WcaK-like protein
VKLVTVLDTSLSTDNLGDEIIMDAVYDVLAEVLPNAYLFKVATHDYMGRVSCNLLRKSELAIVGGTNILDSTMPSRGSLWKVHRFDADVIRPALLLGVGSKGYSQPLSRRTIRFLDKILDKTLIHSVRDEYTLSKVRPFFSNISNTACMTMWKLTPDWCESLPRTKAADVVTTLTHYLRDPVADKKMLDILLASYGNVYFWSQQSEDLEYFHSLGSVGIRIIPPSTAAYTKFLTDSNVDFIGTRLHGGIRALQKGHRALIIGIDNRATEIARDTNLPVISRTNISTIEQWINGNTPTEIKLPLETIAIWKSQFSGMA